MADIMEQKFDTCIVGMWYGINYGSVLTAYALYKTVKDLGYSAIMANKPKQLWNDYFYAENSLANRFARKHLVTAPVFDNYADNEKLNNLSNTFIVGCDTLWHYPLVRTVPTFFFLDFARDGKKKISYASSFGRGFDGPDYVQEKVRHYLGRFDAVSSREKEGIDTCKDLFNVEATQVVDPVFLVDRNHYSELASTSKRGKDKKYVLTYILDPNPDKINTIKWVCEKFGYENINIVDPNNEVKASERLTLPVERNLDVEDWLKLFEEADFVITDSYHGLCFSLIFGKDFICFGNKARGLARFTSLLNLVGLDYRICFDYNDVIGKAEELLAPIDYAVVRQIFDKESGRCREWLASALKMQKRSIDDSVVQLERDLCSGCGACEDVCPVHAISIRRDEFGFLRPKVDENLCVNCGLCAKRCTVLNPRYRNIERPACYAVMADEATRKVSSSGGMFTLAAEYVLQQGGYVCGAAYKDNFEVEHILVNKSSELGRIRGSKYMQSEAGPVYPKVRELLEQNKPVLFTGMPCQVSGLYAYLGKDYPGLYTIDVFCHGITSSKVFEKYHRDVLGGKTLTRLEFKAKEPWGWHAGVNAWFADGTKYSKPLEADPYFGAYLQSISKNLACGTCKVNRLPRQGDLSMGDFWRVEDFDRKLNDGRGTSAVLVNSPKGEEFFKALQSNMTVSREVPLDIAIKGNGSIIHPYMLHKNRLQFFKNFAKQAFGALQSGCSGNRVYEQEYLELVKRVPREEHELYFIARFTAEHARGRQIVTWIRSDRFERILKKYFGLTVAFGVSQRREALVKGRIEDFNILRGKQNQYYLVSLHRSYDDASYKQLQQFGYRPEEDFIFRQFKPIVLEHLDLSKANYYDHFGNSIEGFVSIVGKVVIRGFNNHIMFGKNVNTGRYLDIDICSNSYIDIGDNTNFLAPTKIEFFGDRDAFRHLIIKNNCTFSKGASFKFWHKGSILINEFCTFASFVEMRSNMGKRIIIGRDCMFSYDIELQAGDGHHIFDVVTSKTINHNLLESFDHNDQIVIGEHVWIGKEAFILSGTNIGTGSIIGAKSVVKGIFPNNCTVVGNSARKVKNNIAWSRDGLVADINKCGRPEYVALTSHAYAPISGRKVLVIGGTHFMGIQLVKELLALGNDVTIATRGYTKDNFGMYVHRLILDVSNSDSVKNALHGKFFDIVFDNLAFSSSHVENILSNIKCSKYIQLSSVAVYNIKSDNIIEELFNPLNYRFNTDVNNVEYGKYTKYYSEGKRASEAIVYQKYKNIHSVTVRIPYVTKTDRLLYYCKNILNNIPMNIDDTSRGFTFVQDTEVGKFLPWIAAQSFTGPINLSSEGMVTISMILDYIERKLEKKAVIDRIHGENSPFPVFNEKTFSMNMKKAHQLGYKTSHINDWFWKLMDEYIARVLK